jgi:hypothetical protein
MMACKVGKCSYMAICTIKYFILFTQCPGVQLGYPVPGGNKYRNMTLQVGGVSKIESMNYDRLKTFSF